MLMTNEEKELNKKIKNLELAYQGLLLEYQYVSQKKDEKYNKDIKEQEATIKYYKKEFEEAVEKLEKIKAENEAIKNSRWWKLRKIISKNKKR